MRLPFGTWRKWRAVLATLGLAAPLTLAGCGSGAPAASTPGPRTSLSASPADPATSSPATAPVGTWPGYHFDPARTAAVPGGASSNPMTKAWTADLGGAVYGEALVADGRIYAATETNRVVALDPQTGRVLWSTSLGPPLTNVGDAAGCGNIDPLGITSTPVIDTATGTLFVVGEVSDGKGAVHHQLEGLKLATGAVTVSVNVDPPLPSGERPVALLQRASLALDNGRVYVPYGGNYGDCGHYHGWLVSVNETGAADKASFEVAADGEGGAIWQSGGAPAVDSSGDIFVSTGNANPDPAAGGPDPKQYTESVVKLTPDLKPVASFKDRIAGGDEDLSTANPVLLPGGEVFAVGKTDIGFVLRRQDLSVVAEIKNICGNDPDGGPAYDAALNRMFVPCQDGGIQVVNLSTRSLGPQLPGANSGPILVGDHLWAVHYPDGRLTEYSATSGATLQTVDVGGRVPSFTTPSAGLGLLLVGTRTGVAAFRGP